MSAREGAVTDVERDTIEFLVFEVAARRQLVESTLERELGIGLSQENKAAVDEVEFLGVGPRVGEVGFFEFAVWWDTVYASCLSGGILLAGTFDGEAETCWPVLGLC